uniref:Cna B-type domain-containing protein n=1 Tax=uncultured Methanobrevibacter sp. TaxID=253161 RepID=UPI0025CD3B19
MLLKNGMILSDGVEVNRTVLSDDNNWTYTFSKLPLKSNGTVINYTIQEFNVTYYTVEITGENGSFVIINTHIPGETEVNVTKVWDDADNQDGFRPKNITVILLGDGVEVNRTVLSDDNNWTYTFSKLPLK